MSEIRWGILSTGSIARRLAEMLKKSTTGRLQAVASRDLAKAQALAAEMGAPSAYGSYDELIADPDVDAVYIATPHPMHAEWAIKAAQAGKHILCEKPAAMNLAEVEQMVAAARANHVFFLEAFLYRCHPQTVKLVEMIRTGAIGRVTALQINFGIAPAYAPEHRLFAGHLGGGGILDLGCYCMSMARLIAGAATGLPFAEPEDLQATAILDPVEGGDLASTALVRFPGEILATLHVATRQRYDNTVQIFGSKGRLTVTKPWGAGSKGARFLIEDLTNGAIEEISTEDDAELFLLETDVVARHRDGSVPPHPVMSIPDSLGNARALDLWLEKAGVHYA